MKFGGAPFLYDLNPYESSSVQLHPLGTRAETSDGRKFRYCKAVAALVTGDCYGSAGQDAQFQTMALNHNVAIGGTVLEVTNGTTTVAANDFAEGYLMVSYGTGIGQMSKISSHTTGTSGADITYTIEDPLKVAITAASSKITVVKNPYDDVIIQATTPVAPAVGIACLAIPTSYFGWIQTGGVAAALFDAGTNTTVDLLSITPSSTTAGCVQATTATETQVIGFSMQVVSVDSYVAPVFLTID